MTPQFVQADAQTYGPCYCRIARDKSWAFLQYRQGPSALYHIAADARQTRNVIASHPDRASALRRALKQFAQQQMEHRAVSARTEGKESQKVSALGRKLSEDTLRELRALGYLD